MCATESVSKVLTLIQSTNQATEPPPLHKGNHESIWITTKKVISYKHDTSFRPHKRQILRLHFIAL